MQLHFKATNYEISEEVRDFAGKKLSAISKFVGTEENGEAQIYLELGRETEAHAHGKVWRAEINFDKDGKRFRATSVQESLEDAIDKAVQELSRELRSAKTKNESVMRRGGGAIKAMLRGFKS